MTYRRSMMEQDRKRRQECPKCRAEMTILGYSDDHEIMFLKCPSCGTGGESHTDVAVVKMAGKMWWAFVKAMYGWTQ